MDLGPRGREEGPIGVVGRFIAELEACLHLTLNFASIMAASSSAFLFELY